MISPEYKINLLLSLVGIFLTAGALLGYIVTHTTQDSHMQAQTTMQETNTTYFQALEQLELQKLEYDRLEYQRNRVQNQIDGQLEGGVTGNAQIDALKDELSQIESENNQLKNELANLKRQV